MFEEDDGIVGKSGTQSTMELKNELGIVVGSDPSGIGVIKSIYPAEDVQSIQALYQSAEGMEAFAEIDIGDIMIRIPMPCLKTYPQQHICPSASDQVIIK